MHEHDLDLIADYAAGASGDPDRAARLVASCATCSAEYESQQQIRLLVSSTSVDPLNDLERTRLRRTIWEEAGFASDATPSPARWWERRAFQFASAAAIVFVGIGLVGVLGQLRGQDTTADLLTAEDEAAITQAPVESVERSFATEAAPEAGLDGSEMAGGSVAAADVAPKLVELGEIDTTSLSKAVDETLRSLDGDDAAAATEEDGATTGGDTAAGDLSDDAEVDCELPDAAVTLTASIEGRPVVVAVGVDDSPTRAVAVWADTCEPFDLG